MQSLRVAVADNGIGDRMAEYIFLMHDDCDADQRGWEPYLRRLEQGGFFEGGSAIGGGICVRKSGAPASVTAHLAGFIRVPRSGEISADRQSRIRGRRNGGNPRIAADGLNDCRRSDHRRVVGGIGAALASVVPTLVAGIHVFLGPSAKAWMAGASPAMTMWRVHHFGA